MELMLQILMFFYDVVVIGGGLVGMVVVVKVKEFGFNVFFFDENDYLGGIFLQCIYLGFGFYYFKEEFIGLEFVLRFVKCLVEFGVEYRIVVRVLEIKNYFDFEKVVIFILFVGVYQVWVKVIIYVVGVRERYVFEIGIVGDCVVGIYMVGEV